MSAIDLLIDAVCDYRATLQMTGHRAPRVSVEFEVDAGIHCITVLVEGRLVASASARQLDRAANRCLREFLAWSEDTEEHITHALEVSIEEASHGRH